MADEQRSASSLPTFGTKLTQPEATALLAAADALKVIADELPKGSLIRTHLRTLSIRNRVAADLNQGQASDYLALGRFLRPWERLSLDPEAGIRTRKES